MSASHPAFRAQIRAADPTRSVFVAANAGSGKTRVLTDRVARLLLAGTLPERIVCLTYTTAAAAEMQARLFRRLGDWATMPDAPLAAALAALAEDGSPPAPDRLGQARRLFALALETPGGLRIQTIHAFCDALLRRFPLEAGVSPAFRVLDDRSAARLRAAVLDALASEAAAGGDAAFDRMAALVHEAGVGALVTAILDGRGLLAAEAPPEAVLAALGGRPGEDAAARLAAALGGLGRGEAAEMAAALAGGTRDDRRLAEALRAWCDGAPAEAVLEAFENVVLTEKREPRKSLVSKAILDSRPDIAAWIAGRRPDLLAARERRLAARAAGRSEALNAFARAFLARMAAAKARRGALDFQDLVLGARGLLTASGMAPWVLWKLDGGIDHILVDEAQDTSPAQWEVIRSLADEFLAGEGARPGPRTVFAVGDFKQSIYSFQGAAPAEFRRMRAHFAERLADSPAPLAARELLHSYRSAPVLLRLVDAVFAEESAARGLAGPGETVRHLAFRDGMPGRAELWPFLPLPEKRDPEPWHALRDQPLPEDPRIRLARTLAAEIAGWLARGRLLPEVPERQGVPGRPARAMRPGDILVLVQRRDVIAARLLRELKAAGVPVAGGDRLVLKRQIAVRDLLALLRFATCEEDDLSLAALLRSPLFGLSEEALFALAHGRTGTLWAALRASDHRAAVAVLEDLRAAAPWLRPAEFLDRVLVRHGGRAALLARLGPEAEEAIGELERQAIAYEEENLPDLAGFADWIESGDFELRRARGGAPDQVRVMTVHGAKGLEAPVVILPDTAPRRGGRGSLVLGIRGLPVWPGADPESPEAVRAARRAEAEAEAEERRRLLYVALTRAESLLVVCGAGRNAGIEASWYGLVEAGFRRLGAAEAPAPGGLDGARLVLAGGWREEEAAAPLAVPAAPAALPGWVARPPAPAPAAPRIRPAADLGGAHGLPGEAREPPEAAMARGSLVHGLIERLAPLDPAARAAAGACLAPEEPGLVAEALAVLALPGLAPFLGPGSLAEVPLVAALPGPGGGSLRGRIDRLLVTEAEAVALDFKTNRAVPEAPDAVPEAFLRQMGAYLLALERILPGRRVRAGLVWTAAPRLMWLPRQQLVAAFARAAAIS